MNEAFEGRENNEIVSTMSEIMKSGGRTLFSLSGRSIHSNVNRERPEGSEMNVEERMQQSKLRAMENTRSRELGGDNSGTSSQCST